jgi:SAM-dependent methyltransferase
VNPDDYRQYAFSIDFFSNPTFNKGISRYISLIVNTLPASYKVCDVGGGTGFLLNHILKQREDLIATLIEPSKSMFYQAESLLTSSRVSLMNVTLQESLAKLVVQDVFFFCRSFFAFSSENNVYKPLFLELKNKLSTFGQLFVYEISGLYDIAFYKKKLAAKFIHKMKMFNHHWPVMEFALQCFNDGVKNGKFTLFSRDKLETLAHEAGFDLIYYSSPDLYCFRKRYYSSH